MRPRSDAATDGDRLGRVICDGGLIKRRRKLALLCYVPMTAELIHRPYSFPERVAQRPGTAGQNSLR